MKSFDKFAEKYISFINKLLKYWPIWGVIVFGTLFLRHSDFCTSIPWITSVAGGIWTVIEKGKYILLPLGVIYIACKSLLKENR